MAKNYSMSIVQTSSLSQLSYYVEGEPLLDQLSLELKPNQRVALVGANGCGKSTLMKIIAGFIEPDGGVLTVPDASDIAFLHQEYHPPGDLTVWQNMESVFEPVWELEQQLRALEEEIATITDEQLLERTLKQYEEVQAVYEHYDPATISRRIGRILSGLNFSEEQMHASCSTLSGGWLVRLQLAKILVGDPQLLLLDEPTNHLDLEALEFLEEYLLELKAPLMFVSHDRTFMDKVATHVVHLSRGEVKSYSGNYSHFIEASEAELEQYMGLVKQQQKKLAQQYRFVERFRYKATLARRVQSRLKLLEKEEILDLPELDNQKMSISFESGHNSGRNVLKLKNLIVGYAESSPLTKALSTVFDRDVKLAIVGPNGCGKSTLLKTLMGELTPIQGSYKWDDKVQRSYYAQHQASSLPQGKTAFEVLAECAPRGMNDTELRTLLGCLLFRGNDVFKPVEVLSGGEKSRLALACCVVQKSNVLLLDEPTNHLDLASKESLLEALKQYQGTCILVTHDRYYLNELADAVLYLSPSGPQLIMGDWSYFLEKSSYQQDRLNNNVKEVARPAETVKPSGGFSEVSLREEKQPKKKELNLSPEKLERAIERTEAKLAKLDESFLDPQIYSDTEASQKLLKEREHLQATLQELFSLWEQYI